MKSDFNHKVLSRLMNGRGGNPSKVTKAIKTMSLEDIRALRNILTTKEPIYTKDK